MPNRENLSITITCYDTNSFTHICEFVRTNYADILIEHHNYAPIFQCVIKNKNIDYMLNIYKELNGLDVDVVLRNYKY